MIFVEFVLAENRGKDYFVGEDLESVLADTKNGTEFGGDKYISHKEVPEEEVKTLNFEFFASGVRDIEEGITESYWLGNIR